MANRLFCKLSLINKLLPNNIPNINPYFGALLGLQENTRQLYSKATLGIDGFLKQKEETQKQMENISDSFKEKIQEYCEDISKNMIFSEDLKNMVHLANTDKDTEVVIKMIKKYNRQNKQLRFGNYIFGPVVMRLFHTQNAPDKALECFKAPELTGFFDQLMSYQVLLDLLYENQRYQDVLDTVEIIKERQVEGHKYPRNVVVLAMAACYKMNTKESVEYALKLWRELLQIGHLPMRRATTFCAGLLLNQGDPGAALEVLTQCRNQNYTTVRNIKIAALAEIGRTEYIIPSLKNFLAQDVPNEQKQTYNKDIIERVQAALEKDANVELLSEFNGIKEQLQKQGNILDMTLEEHLCMEIQKPPSMNSRETGFRRNNFEQRPNLRQGSFRRKERFVQNRPGLHELV